MPLIHAKTARDQHSSWMVKLFVIHTTRTGTKIKELKKIEYKDYYGVQVKVLSGNTGEKGAEYSTRVIWKHAGCQYCNDLTGFVYN